VHRLPPSRCRLLLPARYEPKTELATLQGEGESRTGRLYPPVRYRAAVRENTHVRTCDVSTFVECGPKRSPIPADRAAAVIAGWKSGGYPPVAALPPGGGCGNTTAPIRTLMAGGDGDRHTQSLGRHGNNPVGRTHYWPGSLHAYTLRCTGRSRTGRLVKSAGAHVHAAIVRLSCNTPSNPPTSCRLGFTRPAPDPGERRLRERRLADRIYLYSREAGARRVRTRLSNRRGHLVMPVSMSTHIPPMC